MAKLLNWFKERVPFILTIVLLIAIPLYPKFPLAEVKGTWVAVRVDDLLVGLAVILWGLSQIFRGVPIRRKRVFWLILLYWLTGLLANLSALFITHSVSPHLAFLHWFRRIEYMALFFIAFDAFSSEDDLKVFLGTVWLALIGAFTFGMGQKYWGWPVISTMNEEFSKGALLYLDKWTRISSTFAGHYDLAAWLVMILAFAPAAITFLKKWWQKAGIFLASVLGFSLLILTASRVSFIAYILGITITLIVLRRYRWILPVLLVSFFFGFRSKELNTRLIASVKPLLGSAQTLVQRFSPAKPTPTEVPKPTSTPVPTSIVVTPARPKPTLIVKKKIRREVRTWPTPEEVDLAAARSTNIRFKVEWPRAVKAFLKNPVLGTGYSSLGLATDNDYLRMLGETGILGTASLLLLIFHLLRKGLTAVLAGKRFRPLIAGFIGAIFGLAANAIFIDVLEASKIAFYFWILMGIGYRLISEGEKSD